MTSRADKLGRMVRTVYSRLRSQGQTDPKLPPLTDRPPDGGAERARLERALAAAGGALAGVEGKTVATALERIEGCTGALARVPPGEAGDPDVFKLLAITNRNAAALRTATFDELEAAHAAWLAVCAARRAHADYRLLARLLDGYARCYAEAKETF